MVTSCSRKKDKFINRNFHALGTKYNILYNGNIALENGRATVDDAFTDNYWELLPVERMQLSDEILLPGQSKNADFERAEEKAVKAVQTHGMNIQGKEKNVRLCLFSEEARSWVLDNCERVENITPGVFGNATVWRNY